MRGKRLVGAAALTLALATGLGAPAQAAAPIQEVPETETVYVTETIGENDPPRDITASCPAGMEAISGGASVNGRDIDWRAEALPDGTGWVVRGAVHGAPLSPHLDGAHRLRVC